MARTATDKGVVPVPRVCANGAASIQWIDRRLAPLVFNPALGARIMDAAALVRSIGWASEDRDQHVASVHGKVLKSLAARILGGEIAPGNLLPREDELCAELDVSRTSVREAVKVLSAKGLVNVRRRVGARVRPRDDWHLLDPVVLGWHPAIASDQELLTALIEARRILEPAAAELAARRATAEHLARIEAALDAMRKAIPHDLVAVCQADIAFHRAVIGASRNLVLNGMIGMLESALKATFLLTNPLMEAQSKGLSAHAGVLEAIRMRDVTGARAAMNRLLDVAADDLLT